MAAALLLGSLAIAFRSPAPGVTTVQQSGKGIYQAASEALVAAGALTNAAKPDDTQGGEDAARKEPAQTPCSRDKAAAVRQAVLENGGTADEAEAAANAAQGVPGASGGASGGCPPSPRAKLAVPQCGAQNDTMSRTQCWCAFNTAYSKFEANLCAHTDSGFVRDDCCYFCKKLVGELNSSAPCPSRTCRTYARTCSRARAHRHKPCAKIPKVIKTCLVKRAQMICQSRKGTRTSQSAGRQPNVRT